MEQHSDSQLSSGLQDDKQTTAFEARMYILMTAARILRLTNL